MKSCSVCGKDGVHAKGICQACYMRDYRSGKKRCGYCDKLYIGKHECNAIKIDAGEGLKTYYFKKKTKKGYWVETTDEKYTLFVNDVDYELNVGKRVFELSEEKAQYNRNMKKQRIEGMLDMIKKKYGFDTSLVSLEELYHDLKRYYYKCKEW